MWRKVNIVYTRSLTCKHKLNFLLETLCHNKIRCTYPKINLWKQHILLFGENSVGQKLQRRKIRSAKFPFDEISVRRNFRLAKLPFGENFFGEISVGENSGHDMYVIYICVPNEFELLNNLKLLNAVANVIIIGYWHSISAKNWF